MDRPLRTGRHFPGSEPSLLSIRLACGELPATDSPNRLAQSLLGLALDGAAPANVAIPESEAAEFAEFLASTIPSTPQQLETPPLVYQHYELLLSAAGEPWVLGQGAMGVTYKARDLNLRCLVALKVINPRYFSDPSARQRFLREARAAAQLRHPNIASIFHLGFRGDAAFYAMEYIAGETLAERVKRLGPVEPFAALDITAQVALALAAAHCEGFLHRDIKPTNVMLVTRGGEQPGRPVVKVIDFGLVKGIAEAETSSDRSLENSYFIGTPGFASPEQFAHRPLDARTDLYSLGATLFFLLTGTTADAGTRLQDACWRLPVPVANLLAALLQEDAAARPADATEATRLIERCSAEIARSHALPPRLAHGQSSLSAQPCRLHPLRWLVFLLLALIVISAFGGARFSSSKSLKVEVVAVLPLAGSPDDGALAATMTEDLRRALAKQKSLRIVRLAPGTFRQNQQGGLVTSSPLPRRARWLFTGNVQNDTNLLKIEVRLADARNGQIVWSDVCKYSRQVSDLEAIRSDLARKTAADLLTSAFPGSKHFSTGRTVPLEASTALAQGEVYYLKVTPQDNQRAVECCKRALTLAPDFAKAHALLARVYGQSHTQYGASGNWLSLAQASANRAIQLAPDAPEGYNALGFIDILLGKSGEALAANRRAIEASPGYWLALSDYGAIWMVRGHPERALPWLKAAIAIEPDDGAAYSYLAVAYEILCDDDNAARCLQQALRIDPNVQHLVGADIHLCMLQGHWEQAHRLCTEALRANPRSQALLLLQAQMDLIAGDYPRAENEFRGLVASEPTGNTMLYGAMRFVSILGFLRRQQGDYAEGDRLLQQAAEIDLQTAHDGPQNLYDLAATQSAQGRRAEGLEALHQACAAGWLDFRSLWLDPRFDCLRASEEFWRLSTELETKVAAMRREAERVQSRPVTLAEYPTVLIDETR